MEFHEGDIVKHFKVALADEEELKRNCYMYQIKGFATHTETNERLVIYQALYFPFATYARPMNQFYEKIDRNRYPYAKQEYRFEKEEMPK